MTQSSNNNTDGDETISIKAPPNSTEAEQSLLGGLMLDNNAWEKIADIIVKDDFYRKDHQIIFNGISKLIESAEACDVVTLSEFLDNNGELDSVGGLEYIATLANETPGSANVISYAKILREHSVNRSLIVAGNEISGSAFANDGRTASELIDHAERLVFEIAEKGARGKLGFQHIKKVLPNTIDEIEYRQNNDMDVTGVATGFNELDKLTSGFQKGDLVIIAGRPSMGKTTLAINIAENAAIGNGVATAIFSMEMSREALAIRMISSLGRIDQKNLRNGDFKQDGWDRINSAVQMMEDAPIYVDDTPALSPTEVRARARRLKRESNIGLIVLDYLQLMQVPGNNENRTAEVSEISRSLKALARELEIPIIALSQLNRGIDSRTDKTPLLSDLRESGSIEQDADTIAFIYREEFYNPDTPRQGVADINISKQRNGPTGKFVLTFMGKYTKFENHISEGFVKENFQ